MPRGPNPDSKLSKLRAEYKPRRVSAREGRALIAAYKRARRELEKVRALASDAELGEEEAVVALVKAYGVRKFVIGEDVFEPTCTPDGKRVYFRKCASVTEPGK